MVLGRVGGMPVVERDVKAVQIGLASGGDLRHEGLGRLARLLGGNHDGRAVGVVGADETHLVAAHALEPHPGVGLDVLHHVPDVEGRIRVGQGSGDEQAAGHGGILGKARLRPPVSVNSSRPTAGSATWREASSGQRERPHPPSAAPAGRLRGLQFVGAQHPLRDQDDVKRDGTGRKCPRPISAPGCRCARQSPAGPGFRGPARPHPVRADRRGPA